MSAGKGAATAAPEFPRTLAAIQKAEGDLWAIADAVLLEVGPPRQGVDGASQRLEQCSRYLAERGFDYSVSALIDMRRTAHSFDFSARAEKCSFVAHRIAGSPEVLHEAIRRNGGKPPSTRFMEQLKRELREAEEAAERKRQADKRRRAEEKLAAEREKARQARDAEERRKAEERAAVAELRRQQLEREHEEAERKRDERRRKDAEAKAAKAAELLEDQDVADALARDRSLGARRAKHAVHRHEATRRAKVRAENERQAQASALPLPAFVPRMISDISDWVSALRSITDDDLLGLPDDPFVRQLDNVIEDLAEQALRWNTVLGQREPDAIDVPARDVVGVLAR